MAKDDQSPLGAREGDIDAPCIGKEAQVAPTIRAHCREDNHLLLPTLEAVNRRDLDELFD